MSLIFAGEFNVQWFAQQHPGNANQGNEHKHPLHRGLGIEHVFLAAIQGFGVFEQHHVDEHNQYGWGATRCGGLQITLGRVCYPFEEHHEDHVTEQQDQEQNLWQEFQYNAGHTFEVHEVDDRHANAKDHVCHTGDDGQLHLIGVQEDDLIVSHLPDGIQTNGVHTLNMVLGIQLQ